MSSSEIDNEINVSKIIAIDQGLDDSLINNKDDPLHMMSGFNENELFSKQMSIQGNCNFTETPQKVKKEIKLEYEEILEDRWESTLSK